MVAGGVLFTLVFFAAGVFVVNLLWFKPFFINHFFERVFIEYALENPELLTSTRVLKPLGLDFYHDDLADRSEEQALKQLEMTEASYAMLMSYDDDDLSEEQLLSKRVLAAFLEPQLALAEFYQHNYEIDQFFGFQNYWPSFMASQHFIENRAHAEDYIARLKKVSGAMQQLMDGMVARAEKGITPPTFVVDKVIGNVREFLEPSAQKNILYTSFVEKLEKAGIEDDELKFRVAAAIEGSVYETYRKLEQFLLEFRSRTNSDAGVWKFPNGEKFYDLVLWQQTTTRLSAAAIHERGLQEVARIQKEMLSILEGQGFDVGEGFASAMESFLEREDQYYPDTPEGREQILKRYRQIIDEVESQLDDWFDRRHQAEVEVKRIPEFREKSSAGAYYEGPSLDGTKPGTFYANLHDMKATPRYTMRTLAYHEAVPGHHLQVSIASELEGVPTFRRIVPFTAFAEGWALYAERLAFEMGLHQDPLDNLGRLQAELFRAVRLVVDTGIHRFKWTREEAIEYMKANTASADSDVVAEIERYIVLPGQACAYKVGMDFILDQRAKAQRELGDAFDIREFHNAVLENGDVPLSILGEQIDRYIARKKRGAA